MLSRLLITNQLETTTPIEVIKEVAYSQGITGFENDINLEFLVFLNKVSVPQISSLKTTKEWSDLATFINYEFDSWKKKDLINAYNFLIQFMNNDNLINKINNDFQYGLQTPNDIQNINCCVLYRICKDHKVLLNKNTTIHEMFKIVKILKNPQVTLFSQELDLIQNLSVMVYLGRLSDKTIEDNRDLDVYPTKNETTESLKFNFIKLNSLSFLQSKIQPQTNENAVSLAAVIFKTDISHAANPISEYKSLKNGTFPEDKWIKYWYSKNSLLFDLTKTFNPLFSVEYYSIETLKTLIRNEGIEQYEGYDLYELLCSHYLLNTFFDGEQPNLKTRKLMISYEDVDEVPSNELICYGTIIGQMQPTSITELKEAFQCKEHFVNYLDNDNQFFSKENINKLKLILKSKNEKELYNIILFIEKLENEKDKQLRKFLILYNKSSNKDQILKCLNSLLEIGMYMRGWKINYEDYPVKESIVPIDKENELFLKVSESIIKFREECENLKEICKLPLLIFKNDRYITSSSKDEGYTINDRLSLVSKGEETKNINSCLRLSSNWFCCTAHKYITYLTNEEPFIIKDLRMIS